MNERIEKLVIEAFFDESTNGEGQKMYTLGEEKIQKFAELIVEECAQRAEAYAYTSQNFNALAEELRRMIGVK